MAALTVPIAHFGHVIQLVPVFAPAIVLPLFLVALAIKDRRRDSR
jgi:hypothetical protein